MLRWVHLEVRPLQLEVGAGREAGQLELTTLSRSYIRPAFPSQPPHSVLPPADFLRKASAALVLNTPIQKEGSSI